jgi:hypothetical protein
MTRSEGSDGTKKGYSQLHPFIVEDIPTGEDDYNSVFS